MPGRAPAPAEPAVTAPRRVGTRSHVRRHLYVHTLGSPALSAEPPIFRGYGHPAGSDARRGKWRAPLVAGWPTGVRPRPCGGLPVVPPQWVWS